MPDANKILAYLKKKRVAVLKGGWSSEREISLKTGAAVEQSLKRLGIKAISIDVKRDIASVLAKKKINFAFIALHGPFGEDGRIQSLLEIMNIAYTGSGPLASGVAMDKDLSKKIFLHNGVPTAPWAVAEKSDVVSAMPGIRKLLSGGSVFVKPVDQGSAIGVNKVERVEELDAALEACFKYSDRAIVEKFIPGKEITVGILGDVALPVVEIVPQHAFYDFHSKYAKGGSRHIVPAALTESESARAQKISVLAFQSLGCCVYGRVDLILQDYGEIYVLEVNTIPGMTATSLLPDAAKASGMEFDSLVLKILELSLPHAKKI